MEMRCIPLLEQPLAYFLDQNCSNQIGTLTTNENGDTNEVEVTAGTVYIKELSAPKGYKLDTTVRSLKVEAGKQPY